MEALYKLAFEEALSNDNYDLFLNAVVQQKDNQTVLQYLQVLLKYATKALDCDYDNFAKRFIETLPELEDTMSTMAQQLEQRGLEKGAQQGIQQGLEKGVQLNMQNVAKNMINRKMSIDDIAEISGLSRPAVEALKRQLQAEEPEY